MVRNYSTLAIVGLAACAACAADAAAEAATIGTGVFFHILGHNSDRLLTTRQKGSAGDKCLAGQVACDAECIDQSFECCHVGQGQACQAGYSCYSQGCCRQGQTCSGPPKGCTATTKMCDIGCIPKDRVCCDFGDGSSCDSDTVCLASGVCGRQQSELGPSSDRGSGSGSSQTPTSGGVVIISDTSGSTAAASSLKTQSDTAVGASITSSAAEVSSGVYSLSPITTTGEASSRASPTGKPKPTTSAGSSATSSDRGGSGATLKAPAILAGLFAAAAYAI
ncbi:uncharacterized protein LMH87_009220 [Akanthomyces muscarius]|uniref:Uncharacterized protein n=1 Tax=Akanthomyces muscarius TaxID=2231603 RepID=A0A9W8UQG1_AKAMU|nr:uncharacterized protein LMH87_009220 [Akanthomyces muscarius]KAJ4158706.1 hypothetical protein LMH87_009220 [Akanthomyces muscarius]